LAVDRSTPVSSSRGAAGGRGQRKKVRRPRGRLGRGYDVGSTNEGVSSGRYDAPRTVQVESRRGKLKRWAVIVITSTPAGGIWVAGRRLGRRTRDFDGEVERVLLGERKAAAFACLPARAGELAELATALG
jgi:hypothetical protein